MIVSKTKEYTKYIDYLKTNQRRVIEYDLEGNVCRELDRRGASSILDKR